MENVLSDNCFYSTTSRTTVPNPTIRPPPSGRWEAANNHSQRRGIGLRACGGDLMQPSPKIYLQDDYFRSTWQPVKLFYAKRFTLLTQRAIETTKRQNWTKLPFETKKWPFTDRNQTELFLKDCSVEELTVLSKFCRFIVLRSRQKNQVNFEFWIWNVPGDGRDVRHGVSNDPTWVRDRGPTGQWIIWMMDQGMGTQGCRKSFLRKIIHWQKRSFC